MSVDVGADIKARCGKCKLNTWHVVVAKVQDRIAKVQCKSCGAQHKYRAPAGAEGAAPAARRRTNGKSRAKAAAAPQPSTPVVEADLSKPIRPYSPREQFATGERIDHPKFGIGVVEETALPGKMTVCFADQRRVLATAKESSGLQRPDNRTFDT